MRKDHIVIKSLINQLFSLSYREFLAFLLMVVAIPISLISLHIFFFYYNNQYISPEIIFLSLKSPTISGMFLSNYLHSTNSNHLFGNTIFIILITFFIWFIWYIIMPIINYNPPKLFLIVNYVIFLTVLPFCISIAVLPYMEIFNYEQFLGFSGIVCAFIGLIIFIISRLTYDYIKSIKENDIKLFYLIILLLGIFISTPLITFLFEIGQKNNAFCHITGYCLGFIIPLILWNRMLNENYFLKNDCNREIIKYIGVTQFLVGLSLPLLFILLIDKFLFLLSIFLILINCFKLIKENSKIKDYIENNLEYESEKPHNAIIIAINDIEKKDNFRFIQGIDLLVNYFLKNDPPIPYKICIIDKKEEAKEIILNENTEYLWLFGHGTRNILCFSDENLCYYEVKDAPMKKFIGQYHCNSLIGNSLADYLEEKYSKKILKDITRWPRYIPFIRYSIKKTLKRLSFSDLYEI